MDLADVSSTNDHISNAVDILIGSDHYWDAVIGDVIRGKCGLVAVRSKFEWLLSGPARSTNAASNEVVSNLILEGPNVSETFENDSQLVEDLRQFWDTEIVGILPEPKEVERDSFMEIKFDWLQQRYKVNLPWKAECRPLDVTCVWQGSTSLELDYRKTRIFYVSTTVFLKVSCKTVLSRRSQTQTNLVHVIFTSSWCEKICQS